MSERTIGPFIFGCHPNRHPRLHLYVSRYGIQLRVWRRILSVTFR